MGTKFGQSTDFPGHPVVKTWASTEAGVGSISGQELRSHRPHDMKGQKKNFFLDSPIGSLEYTYTYTIGFQ